MVSDLQFSYFNSNALYDLSEIQANINDVIVLYPELVEDKTIGRIARKKIVAISYGEALVKI